MIDQKPHSQRPAHPREQRHGADAGMLAQSPGPHVGVCGPGEVRAPFFGRQTAEGEAGGDEALLEARVQDGVAEARAVGE